MMGGYGGGYGGGMGGYGSPFGGGMGGYGGGFDASRDFSGMGGFGGFGGYGGGGMGGYGTQFGGYDMGGGGGFGGYGGGMRAPAYQPTINDAFSNYFSQQYYGGPAFNPFAATSMFGGGGYGGGFGGGRRGGGRRGGGRQLRQMFEDYFQPEGNPMALPAPQPQPQPVSGVPIGTFGTSRTFSGPNALRDGFNAMEADRIAREQRNTPIQPQPPQMAPGYGNAPPSPVFGPGGGRLELGPQRVEEFPGQSFAGLQQVQPSPFAPQPYMVTRPYGGDFIPFDQTLPAKSEAPMAPAAQGFDSIMPVQQQDTPVQSAPMAPTFYEPPPPAPTFYAPPPPAQTLYEPPPPAPTFYEPPPMAPSFYEPPPPAPMLYEPPPMAPSFYEPPVMAPFVPSFEPAVFEPQPYIPPMQTYAPEPMPFVPAQIESPFYRPSRDMFVDDFVFEMR